MKVSKPSEELRTMFRTEWFRAKKILKPALDGVKMPRLFQSEKTGTNLGYHLGSPRQLSGKLGGHWYKGQHLITVRVPYEHPQVLQTIRHEICHVVQQNHSPKFKALLSELMR